jgi:type IV secretion system protein VirD4
MKNTVTSYAGHRLSPWLGHVMISRQETARPLLTPGEVMQLPATDEIVMVAGCQPIRARKARYFEDSRLKRRIMPPPEPGRAARQCFAQDEWSNRPTIAPTSADVDPGADHNVGGGGLRWEAEVEPPDLAAARAGAVPEDEAPGAEPEQEADDLPALEARFRRVARQAALDPDDGLGL